MPSGARR